MLLQHGFKIGISKRGLTRRDKVCAFPRVGLSGQMTLTRALIDADLSSADLGNAVLYETIFGNTLLAGAKITKV